MLRLDRAHAAIAFNQLLIEWQLKFMERIDYWRDVKNKTEQQTSFN